MCKMSPRRTNQVQGIQLGKVGILHLLSAHIQQTIQTFHLSLLTQLSSITKLLQGVLCGWSMMIPPLLTDIVKHCFLHNVCIPGILS